MLRYRLSDGGLTTSGVHGGCGAGLKAPGDAPRLARSLGNPLARRTEKWTRFSASTDAPVPMIEHRIRSVKRSPTFRPML